MVEKTPQEGQILSGALFEEPMRVESVRREGPEVWVVGLVGTRSERFRRVTLTRDDLEALILSTSEARARNGTLGALEEDARLTALFLWTLQTTKGENGEANPEEEEEEEDFEEEGEEDSPRKPRGYALVYDVVRRFAQPLGIDLARWEGRVIKTEKGIVRLLSLSERARVLFGREGAEALAHRLEGARPRTPKTPLRALFPEAEETRPRERRPGRAEGPDRPVEIVREATTLDWVHTAMLLQASGRTNALRALLEGEKERGPDFLRLANALSALYPQGSEEKRLLDAMLLAVPR